MYYVRVIDVKTELRRSQETRPRVPKLGSNPDSLAAELAQSGGEGSP